VKNTPTVATELIIKKVGSRKVNGGVLPMITSRNIPPPIAVVKANTNTPKTSSRFCIPVNAPEIAKATTPIISKTFHAVTASCPLFHIAY
jgi:hypothetical protein